MEFSQNLVSVNMIAFNASKYIAESIESVLCQTYSNWELIVIDDGSTDDTLKIANSYAVKDERIKVFSNGQNEGIVYSRNRAVHYSQGKYIAVLDSDDIALPDRLQKQVEFMDRNPDYGAVGSAFYFIDEHGVEIGRGELNAKPEYFRPLLLFNNFFLHSSVMMKTELIKQFLYRPLVKGCAPGEEYRLFVDIARNNIIWNLPDYLVKYREINTGISKVRKDKIDEYTDKIIISQLNSIGINPTKVELKLHKSIRFAFDGLSISQIKEIKKWMELLISQDAKYKIFGSDLNNYLSNKFYEICRLNANLGLSVFILFKTSMFRRSKDISREMKAHLFSRCLYESRRKVFGK
ncbi:MAG: glycosyltransferase family 2 protein [Bacteroidota bacterium]